MQRFFKDTQGATAIEYALIIAVILMIALVGMLAIGTNTSTVYNNASTALQNN